MTDDGKAPTPPKKPEPKTPKPKAPRGGKVRKPKGSVKFEEES